LIGAITALLFLSLVIGILVFYCRITKKKSAKNVAITTLKVEEYDFDECTNEESRGSCGDDYPLPPLETDYLSKDPYFQSRKEDNSEIFRSFRSQRSLNDFDSKSRHSISLSKASPKSCYSEAYLSTWGSRESFASVISS